MTRLTFGGVHAVVKEELGLDLSTEKVIKLRNSLLNTMREGPAVREETIDRIMDRMEDSIFNETTKPGIRDWLKSVLETEVSR